MTVDEQIESALRQTGKPLEIAAADIIRDQRQMIDYYKEQLDSLMTAFGVEKNPNLELLCGIRGAKGDEEK